MITLKMISDRINRMQVYRSAKYWDDLAESSYGDNGTLLYTNPHLNVIYHKVEGDIVHGWASNVAGAAVLDIGCGAGRYSREFAERGARVHGIDFSQKSIEVARRLSTDTSVHYSVGSIFDLNFDREFEWVVCSRVLAVACKNADDVKVCADLIFRALKPGGKALFIEPTHRSFMRRDLRLNLREFQCVLSSAGFEVIDTKCAEFYPSRMLLAYLRLPEGLTQNLFAAGEAIVRSLPRTSDQKFVLAVRK